MYKIFEVLHDALRDKVITLNTTAANEHVPTTDKQIKMVKERVRSTWNLLPYKKCSNRMISIMVENAVLCINGLPVNSGMSYMISLQTHMTGTIIDFKKHCKIEFNAYAEAHEKVSTQLQAILRRTRYLPRTNMKTPR